jgi:tRNA-specific 2-thiouridylase
VAEKPDSQDICFVPQGRYARVVERLQPGAAEPGEIVDLEGRVLGRHEGVIHYTVGQRRGLGIPGSEPLYVVRLEASRRRVVVGPKAALGCTGALLREVNWLDGEEPAPEGLPVAVKLRSASPAVPALLLPGGEVRFAAPEAAVAPGQACVFYRDSRVLGGGFIARSLQAEAA